MFKDNKKLYNTLYNCYLLNSFYKNEFKAKQYHNSLQVVLDNYKLDLKSFTNITLIDKGFSDEIANEILYFFEYRTIPCLSNFQDYFGVFNKIITSRVFDIEDLHKILIFKDFRDDAEFLVNLLEKIECENFPIKKKHKYRRYIEFLLKEDFPVDFRSYNADYETNDFKIKNKKFRGSFHNHTTYSDGINSINELCNTFLSLDMKYIGISEHSKFLFLSGGIDENDLFNQKREIDELNLKFSNFRILKGIECEILDDGSLDFQNEILKTLDYVIISTHNNLYQSKDVATKRIIRAIENPYSNILGHPTSRCYKRTPGLELDMYKIIDACIANNVIVEINSDPDKLDIDIKYIEYAENKGAKFTIEADSHSVNDIKNFNYGILIAEKVNLNACNCINTYSLDKILHTFNK